MGNASSSTAGSSASSVRDRHRSGDSLPPNSPGVTKDGQAFPFDKSTAYQSQQHGKLILQTSNDDDEPYYTKPTRGAAQPEEYSENVRCRKRASTVSEGTKVQDKNTSQQKALPTVLKWTGGGKDVFICGTFSDWKTIPMVKSHGDFVTIVDLPEGDHEYKFFVDGEWRHNPNDPSVNNDSGTKNNLIKVKRTDFEVFDALAMDSVNANHSHHHRTVSGSPPGSEWGQEQPPLKPSEKLTGPPFLPPHLLQVILNKDTPLSCEPTLLPEPNHVMLNHLYALSIKDGVMVLSATHRYRKKYVTTLLYKPI